jgi:hypothetical protein
MKLYLNSAKVTLGYYELKSTNFDLKKIDHSVDVFTFL